MVKRGEKAPSFEEPELRQLFPFYFADTVTRQLSQTYLRCTDVLAGSDTAALEVTSITGRVSSTIIAKFLRS